MLNSWWFIILTPRSPFLAYEFWKHIGQAEQQAAVEEAKEASKALERQRSMALTELHGLVARGQIVGLEVGDADDDDDDDDEEEEEEEEEEDS